MITCRSTTIIYDHQHAVEARHVAQAVKVGNYHLGKADDCLMLENIILDMALVSWKSLPVEKIRSGEKRDAVKPAKGA
jgi:hypothetical protein